MSRCQERPARAVGILCLGKGAVGPRGPAEKKQGGGTGQTVHDGTPGPSGLTPPLQQPQQDQEGRVGPLPGSWPGSHLQLCSTPHSCPELPTLKEMTENGSRQRIPTAAGFSWHPDIKTSLAHTLIPRLTESPMSSQDFCNASRRGSLSCSQPGWLCLSLSFLICKLEEMKVPAS